MKTIIVLTVFILVAAIAPQGIFAQEVQTSSARLANRIAVKKDYALDVRTQAVRNIFKRYNSPLVDQASLYVRYADEFGVDWRLLPSIAGLESTFGKFLMPGSYNAYGWGGGYIYFESWEHGIRVVNRALRRNYMEKWGATDVWSIGPIYAESPTWSVRVNFFMNQFEQEYKRLTVFSLIPSI
jgi:hypothetical protein